jgi:nucleoside-diphosphate-sugar epimerase
VNCILVTGASGFVGRELVKTLSSHGICGLATGRTPTPDLPGGWKGYSREAVLNGPILTNIPKAVIHLEVRQHVSKPKPADILDFQAVNVDGTRKWLAWATATGIQKFVFASSVKAVRPGSGETLEDVSAESVDPYGRSKALAEAAVREWASADESRQATILRFAPVYGPRNEANLAAFAAQVARGRPCYVGRGTTLKSVVSLRNAVAALEFAVNLKSAGLRIFNCSDPTTLSVAALAELIAEASAAPKPKGIPESLAKLGAIIGDIFEWAVGVTPSITTARLRAITTDTAFPPHALLASGFEHVQTTQDGIDELVNWMRREGRLSGRESGQQTRPVS